MKRSKSENKGQRRRSWFNGASSIFHLFSSAPNSPMNEYNKQLTQADVYQQNDTTDTCQPKSTSNRLSSIISKATKKHRRKFSTVTQDTDITANSKNPQYNTSSTLLDDPCLGSSSCSMRRNSSKSEATTLSDNCIDHPNQSHIIKNTQLVTSDEEEIDRIQLKNDLVKLAFEG
ncbi:hypothetical protein BDB01DRAFT_270660 [Pilobolus umbonatus]|nr:hypothetical protein BDB01DRAFT_270660 [Pilobolus umbonatus]